MAQKVKTMFSKMQGKRDDAKFKTVAEFCRVVANETLKDCYGYFTSFYAAFIADTLYVRRDANETTQQHKERVLQKALQLAKSTPTKELKQHFLYGVFSSKNQLFKLVRNIAPAYYNDKNKHLFAKQKTVAFNAAKYTSETAKEMQNNGFQLITLQRNGKEIVLLTKRVLTKDGIFSVEKTLSHYNEKLQEKRMQRKERFAEMKETTVYYWDANDNICTLVADDKLNFEMLYTYISEYAQRNNFERVQLSSDKEAKRNRQRKLIASIQKQDEKVSKTFAELLQYRNNVNKENNGLFVEDETKRQLIIANFVRMVALYKDACNKRFENWDEKENGFLQDTFAVWDKLTKQQQPVADGAKVASKANKQTKVAA